MDDFKKLIQVADVYGKTDQQIQEGKVGDFVDSILVKLGLKDEEAAEIAKNVEDKATSDVPPEFDKLVTRDGDKPKEFGVQSSSGYKVLDPQPRGYGPDQGKIIVQSGDRYLEVDVSKKVKNPYKDTEAYSARSIKGYEYDPADPQAPTTFNADQIYLDTGSGMGITTMPPEEPSADTDKGNTTPDDSGDDLAGNNQDDGIQGMAPIEPTPAEPQQPVANPDENEPEGTTDNPVAPEPETDPLIPGRTAPDAPEEPRDGDDLGTAPTKPKEPEKARESESPLLQFMRKNKGGLANDPDEVAAIKELQGILGIAQDGKYGPATRAAVRKYQQDNGLRADGDAGSQTISKMKQQADPGGFDTPGNDLTRPNESVNEASMNISMNGASSAEVAELMGILKNAGMPDAAEVAHMHMPMPEPESSGCGCGESPCGCMGEESVEEEYENEPEESYADAQYMTHDLAGGINKSKKAYKATPRGDNPMSVKEQYADMLAKALSEKLK